MKIFVFVAGIMSRPSNKTGNTDVIAVHSVLLGFFSSFMCWSSSPVRSTLLKCINASGNATTVPIFL